MKTIFDNANCGNKFITTKNKILMYIKKHDGFHYLLPMGELEFVIYNDYGKCVGSVHAGNIVSQIDIQITEDKINELAQNTQEYEDGNNILYKDSEQIYYASDLDIVFKAGCKKIIEMLKV